MTPQLDYAWAAGFIDGEGCISIAEHRPRTFVLHLSLSQTTPIPLLKLQEMFGGGSVLVKKQGGLGSRPMWQWRVDGRTAARALAAVMPFLLVKKNEAALGLMFSSQIVPRRGRHPREQLPPMDVIERDSMRLALMDYHKGDVYERPV